MPSPRSEIALVTCDAFPHLYEDDLPLVPALAALGLHATPAVWSDTSVDWASFDAVVMRSPWDYYERATEFRPWLDARIAAGSLLCNSADILDWNYDKRYLRELVAAGVAVVPTIHVGRGEKADVAASRGRARLGRDRRQAEHLGRVATAQHRLRVAEADALRPGGRRDPLEPRFADPAIPPRGRPRRRALAALLRRSLQPRGSQASQARRLPGAVSIRRHRQKR